MRTRQKVIASQTSRLLWTFIAAAALLVGCNGSEAGAGAPVDGVSGPPDVVTPDLPLTDIANAAELTDDVSDVPAAPPWEDPQACHPEGDFVGWDLGCARVDATIADGLSAPPAHLDFVAGGDRSAVAWATGETVSVRAGGADGTPLAEAVVIEAEGPVSGLVLLRPEAGFLVLFSVGDHDSGPADEVRTFIARVGDDGALGEGPALLSANLRLRPGAVAAPGGFRLWGVADEVLAEQTFRMAVLVDLSSDGVLRHQHTIRPAGAFGYFRLHGGAGYLHAPFVSAEEPAVSYFLQPFHIPGCGVPTLPVLDLGERRMLATAYAPSTSVWVLGGPGACDGAGTVALHDTNSKQTVELPLSFTPTDRLAAIAVSEAGPVVVTDAVGDRLLAARLDIATPEVSVPRTIAAISGEEVADLRLAVGSQGALSLRVRGIAGAWSLITATLCAAPR